MTQSDYKLILINHKNQYSCLNKHIISAQLLLI